MKKNLILLLSVLMATLAYGQKNVYFNSDYAGHTFENIRKIAILPFATPISSQNVSMERIKRHRRTTYGSSQSLDMRQLMRLQNSRALEFQNDLYSSLLERSDLHDKLQNTKITNALLNKNKIGIDSLENYTPKELAKLLNVDAILYGSVTRRISGYGRHSSNIIHCVISLNDKTNIQIWQYNISQAKSLKKSEDNIISTILRKAMKKFPPEYQEKKTSKFRGFFKRK